MVSVEDAMYELSQSRGLLHVCGLYIFMHVSMVAFVGSFVQRCWEAFPLNKFCEFLGMARRGYGKHTNTVSMGVSLSSWRDVLVSVKRQLL